MKLKKIYWLSLIQQNIVLLLILVIVVMLTNPLLNYKAKYKTLDIDTVSRTIDKYMIQCYASEGSYPPDLEYLAEHYGLILDEDKYIYRYEIFASNIKPDVMIFVNQAKSLNQTGGGLDENE